jgi:transcriptional regulator with GAF, ATPase, and Fis domain
LGSDEKEEPMAQKSAETIGPAGARKSAESLHGRIARELVELYVRQTCINDHLCLKEAIERLERDIIFHVLEQTNGNQREAAEILGIKPSTLFYKLRRMGITPVHKYVLPNF